MKTCKTVQWIGLAFMVTAAHAATITMDARSRTLTASAGGSGATNFTTQAGGGWQKTFHDSSQCGCVPFPGYGTSLDAWAAQDSNVGLTNNHVLSISGSGDVNALTTITTGNQYGNVSAASTIDVSFTTDGPLPYSVSASVSFPVGTAYVYLVQKNGGGGYPVFGFGHSPFNPNAPHSGTLTGTLPAGSYQFVAHVDGGSFGMSGAGHFDTAFKVAPVLLPFPPPALTMSAYEDALLVS